MSCKTFGKTTDN